MKIIINYMFFHLIIALLFQLGYNEHKIHNKAKEVPYMESAKMSITEIAKRAGTSAATVSRVLNHPELVNSETAEQIRAAMEELG